MPVYDRESLELLGEWPPESDELAIAGEAYEGASRFKKELATYVPSRRSADQDMAPAKRIADVRTRDLVRNDAFLQGGATLRKDNIVGSYYMLNARPNSKMLFGKLDEVWEEEFQEEVEELFAAFAESNEAWMDAGRRNTFTALVRMAMDQHTVYGEYLATVEWVRDPGRPFNTCIQMIDTDRLMNPPTYDPLSDNISMGVRLDSRSAPIGYYIRKAHPSEFRDRNSQEVKYVPVRKPWGRLQVLHQYEQLRPGQTRGLGVMVAAIPELKMSKQFRDIVLQNAILNATYAATIESDLPTEAIFAHLGGSDMVPEALQEAFTNYMKGYYNTLDDLTGGSKNLTIDGVRIPHLPPGSKLHLNGAGDGGPLGTDFEVSLNRVAAAALGVSYEQYTRDYTNTNYSGFKGGLAEAYKTMLAVKRLFSDRFASSGYQLFLEEALNKGAITSIRRNMPSWYEGLNATFYSACDWIGASRGQIDELKETEAAVMRIENGLSTYEQETARLGNDWRKQMRQIKREKEMREAMDILKKIDASGEKAATSPASVEESKPAKKGRTSAK